MIKKDLIKLVSKDTGLSVKDCNTVLNSLSKIIKDRLFFGVDVTIGNFLTFKIHRMKERPGRNPKSKNVRDIFSQHVFCFMSYTYSRDLNIVRVYTSSLYIFIIFFYMVV